MTKLYSVKAESVNVESISMSRSIARRAKNIRGSPLLSPTLCATDLTI